MKNIVQQLKEINGMINPDSFWVIENKNKLMRQILPTTVARVYIVSEKTDARLRSQVASVLENIQIASKVFASRRYIRSLRSVMALVLALLLTTSGWVASAYAEPGDALWTAKTAWNSVVEKSQLAVTAEEDEAPLHLQFAAKQAHVLKQVVEQEDVEPEKKDGLIKKNSEDLEKKLAVADQSLKKASVETATDFVKDVSLKTQEISDVLKQSVEQVNKNGTKSGVLNVALVEGLDKAVAEVQKTSLDMVETVVQKKTDGNIEISAEEKTIIKNHIDVMVEDIHVAAQKAKTQVDELKVLVEAEVVAEKHIANSNASTTFGSMDFTSTSSVPVLITSTPTTTVATKEALDQALKKADETTVAVDAHAHVADQIVEGNVLEALQAVRQLNETVTQTVKEVQKVGKEIIPNIQNSGRASETTTSVVPLTGTSTSVVGTTTVQTTNSPNF
ncbi:MAG: hypothetical protein HYV41_04890 [Candidatus Magasanikbacteria bacterium]|nr:hypothetical protein [Candidatus Magasanikbacteria bacterium]